MCVCVVCFFLLFCYVLFCCLLFVLFVLFVVRSSCLLIVVCGLFSIVCSLLFLHCPCSLIICFLIEKGSFRKFVFLDFVDFFFNR